MLMPPDFIKVIQATGLILTLGTRHIVSIVPLSDCRGHTAIHMVDGSSIYVKDLAGDIQRILIPNGDYPKPLECKSID